MIELLLKVLASYFVGSLIGGLIVGRLRGGVDIRTLGSGNAGGTNALRTQGKSFALWVMLIDIGKGILATRVIAPLPLQALGLSGEGVDGVFDTAGLQGWSPVACGLAAILGHVYPVWYGFRGGKGVATLIGVVFGVEPVLLAVVLAVWLVMVMLFGFVGLASIVAALSIAGFVAVTGMQPHEPLLFFGIAVSALVVFTHRSNLARMRAGTEPRARRLWLLGRARPGRQDQA
ncbi:MAG: glycerol-3-phosphate 1-O-acyltransferase PlsY [Gammaproteobacteria bacterium]